MKTFTSLAPTADELSLIEFGVEWWTMPLDGSNPISGTETFKARRAIPPGFQIAFASAVQLDARGNRVYDVNLINQVMKSVLLEDDHRRFDELLWDKERHTTIEQLGEITMWLGEQITGRPTGQPST